MKWYYEQNGQQQGPVNEEQLRAFISLGTITPESQVWRKGLSDWTPAEDVPGLLDGPPPMQSASDVSDEDDAFGYEEEEAAGESIDGDAFRALVVEALTPWSEAIDDLFVGEDIPGKKLANASRTCDVPSSETIVALLDATVFGSAKNALVVGTHGVYFHNGWDGAFPGAGRVRYAALVDGVLTEGSWCEVSFGKEVCFNTAGSSASVEETLDVLRAVREILRVTGYRGDA